MLWFEFFNLLKISFPDLVDHRLRYLLRSGKIPRPSMDASGNLRFDAMHVRAAENALAARATKKAAKKLEAVCS